MTSDTMEIMENLNAPEDKPDPSAPTPYEVEFAQKFKEHIEHIKAKIERLKIAKNAESEEGRLIRARLGPAFCIDPLPALERALAKMTRPDACPYCRAMTDYDCWGYCRHCNSTGRRSR